MEAYLDRFQDKLKKSNTSHSNIDQESFLHRRTDIYEEKFS